MAKNEERRRCLLDAAIRILAQRGARGLTHRAVDSEAGVPNGTASNYFRSRDTLVAQIFDRIGERLRPNPAVGDELAKRPPSKALFADYVRDIVLRLTQERDVTLALLELRLESTRNSEVAARLQHWLDAGFAADVAFNESARLPGGAKEIALFHYAIDGLILDRLTCSIDPQTSTDAVIDALVSRLLPERSWPRPRRPSARTSTKPRRRTPSRG